MPSKNFEGIWPHICSKHGMRGKLGAPPVFALWSGGSRSEWGWSMAPSGLLSPRAKTPPFLQGATPDLDEHDGVDPVYKWFARLALLTLLIMVGVAISYVAKRIWHAIQTKPELSGVRSMVRCAAPTDELRPLNCSQKE